MIKLKVKKKLTADIINKIRETVDDEFVRDVQREVIDGTIKPMIAAGVSPVDTGKRRFVGYKNPKSYPGKRKEKRPVSLKLTGQMLNQYVAEKISGVRIRLGISKAANSFVKTKAQANNEGTLNGIPARRFIPLKGEGYRVSVLRKLKSLYAKRIKRLISSK